MRIVPVIAIALLIVTAGCSAFSGSADDPATVAPRLQSTPTTSTPTTSTPDVPYPPGVTPNANDEVDERALYIAHEEFLENRSKTWRQQHVWTNSTGTVLYWSSLTVWSNGSLQRYESESGGADPSAVPSSRTEYDYWTNGCVTVSQQQLPNGSVVRRVTEDEPPGAFANVGAGRTILESAFIGNDLEYVGTEQRANQTLHVLVATPAESRFTMRVTSEGVVRSFVLRLQTEVDGEPISIVRRFRTYDIGTTTVEKPDWVTPKLPIESSQDEQ